MAVSYLMATEGALRVYTDSTLNGMSKKALIRYIRTLEKNIKALNERLDIQQKHLEEMNGELDVMRNGQIHL